MESFLKLIFLHLILNILSLYPALIFITLYILIQT